MFLDSLFVSWAVVRFLIRQKRWDSGLDDQHMRLPADPNPMPFGCADFPRRWAFEFVDVGQTIGVKFPFQRGTRRYPWFRLIADNVKIWTPRVERVGYKYPDHLGKSRYALSQSKALGGS